MLELCHTTTAYIVGLRHPPDESRDGTGPVPACEVESVTQRRTRGALLTKGETPS